jgi:uncharacterized protein
MSQLPRPEFLCDAMLGGLARWLRAAGYAAEFIYGIDDADLVRRAQATGAVLLSSDGKMFERKLLRDGVIACLYIPMDLKRQQQLSFVLSHFHLALRPMPCCMACGGELAEVDKRDIEHTAPPRSYAAFDQFWRCTLCGKLLWRGTHWDRIQRALAQAVAKTQ